MKRLNISWIVALVMILLAVNVSAIGLSPAKLRLEFVPGYEGELTLTVINNELKDQSLLVYADGELAKYIEFKQQRLSVSADEVTKDFTFKVKFPRELDRQGVFKNRIIVAAVPDAADGADESVIKVAGAVASEFVVTLPYSGKYIEATPFIMSDSSSEPVRFSIAIRNLGTEDVNSISALVRIKEIDGSLVEELWTGEISLKKKSEGKIEAVSSSTLPAGAYVAEIEITYDGEVLKLRKEFSVGEMDVDIISVSSERFKLGEINKLDILVQNTWNRALKNVFAEGIIRDRDSKVAGNFKTASVDINPRQISPLTAFWDTAEVIPGFYTLDLVVKYANRLSTKTFQLEVSSNSLKTGVDLTGHVVSEGGAVPDDMMRNLVIFIVIFLIVINAIVIVHFRRRRRRK